MNAPANPAALDAITAARARALKVVIVGHVDHGKSTLTGRLIHDSGSLPEGKLEALQKSCERRGVPFEWAFLMDAFQSERDQNVTIDTAQIFFSSKKRPYVIIDAPGHREFLKNMVTGAAQADTALLLVAADEGVKEQSRRHGTLLSLLGVKDVIVVVNKMDRIGFDAGVFAKLTGELGAFLAGLGITPRAVVPVSARDGDNLVHRSARTPFYDGPTVLELLDEAEIPVPSSSGPVVFPIQDIYRFDHRRILAGRLESGTLAVGDTLAFFPGGKTSRVASIEAWSAAPRDEARAGESIGITLEEQIFVERGQVAVRAGRDPIAVATTHEARLFWLGKRALTVGSTVRVKLATEDVRATVTAIHRVLDASTLDARAADRVEKDDVAELTLETKRPIAHLDPHEVAALGRFVVVDGYDLAGGGVLTAVRAETARVDAFAPVAIERRLGIVVALPTRDATVDAHALASALRALGDDVVRLDDGVLPVKALDQASVAAVARALAHDGHVVLAPASLVEDDGGAPVITLDRAASLDEALTTIRGARRAPVKEAA